MMADKTITQLTATTSAATADEIPIWVAGSAVTRKITKANFLQGAFTGGGTVATGGFTLTVPATGTAALLTAGTWSPTLAFNGESTGIVYNTAIGSYQRVGDVMWISGHIRLSDRGSAMGVATIGGLPVASSSTYQSVLPFFWLSMTSNLVTMMGQMTGTTLYILGATAAAGSVVNLTHEAFSNGSYLYWSGSYQL